MRDTVHVIGITVRADTAEDAAGLRAALPRLADEDATVAYHIHSDDAAATLAGTSEGHLEMALDRLIRGFGLQLTVSHPEIAFRETITRTVDYEYAHKRISQSGGEFARVKIRFEPLSHGSPFVFVNAPGSRLPSDYAAAVGEALHAAARRGDVHRGGYPIIDVMATLIDGAYHDTDSSAQTFETAARACFSEGIAKAGPRLLEPVMKVSVLTPEEFMGDVIGDLNRRGGTISGMSPGMMRTIDALVPFRHTIGYDSHLRGMTRRRASWTTQFDHYAPLRRGDDLDPIHPGAAMGLR